MSFAPVVQDPRPSSRSVPPGFDSEPPPAKGSSGKKLLLVLVLVLLVGGAVWRIVVNRRAQQEQAAKAAAAQQSDRPIPVTVAPVQQKSMPIYLTGLGSVTAYYTVTIKSRVDGQLMRVNFREGQEVKAGDLLAVIDPRPYQATLEQAQGQLTKDLAQLANFKAELARYNALYTSGVVSKETLDLQQSNYGQYEGTVKADQATIDSAKVNLAYTRITSPINGRIGLRIVDPGNIVHATDATGLLVITQLRPIAVIFTLPEDQLPQVIKLLHKGQQPAVVAYDRSDTQQLATGKLLTVDNQIDQTTGTDKLKAVFANEDDALFPNQFVNIRLIVEQRQNAIVIPAAALQHGSEGDFVYVVDADKSVTAQLVKVDLTEGQDLLIGSGLHAGQQVVVDGQEKLRTGSKVITRIAGTGAPATVQVPGTTRNPASLNEAAPNAAPAHGRQHP